MEKCIIAAVADNLAIGRDNALLWHIPADMKYFKALTTGSPVIMGRKTFESIGRPLPKRLNIVITRSDMKTDGVQAAHSLEEALELAEDNSSDLDNVAEKAEYLQDLKEDIWDITGSFSVPTVSYQQWVDDEVYSIYSQIQSISSSMTQNRYTEEITKLTLESTVKSYFTSILSDESSLEVAKKEAEVKKTQYLKNLI